MRSFTRFPGVTVHLYSYDRELNPGVPGCVCHDASEFLPREVAERWRAAFGGAGFAAVSTLFRYSLLYQKGGWYFDTDCILTKPLTPLFELDYVFGWESATRVCNAVLKFPRNNEMFDQLYKECAQMNPDTWHPGDFVPFFTQYLKKFNLISKALPREYFYPIYAVSEQPSSCRIPYERTFIVHLFAAYERLILPARELSLQNKIRSLENQIYNLNSQVDTLTNQIQNLNNSLSLKMARRIPFGKTIRKPFVKHE
ncbi:MAG: glycosyltransferase [Candidatus Bathyarchaeia archaeon]